MALLLLGTLLFLGVVFFSLWAREETKWRIRGEALSRLAFAAFGVVRLPGESDRRLRKRILQKTTHPGGGLDGFAR